MAIHTTDTMKERPILFSAPMVRALLAGRKTQTRRIVKSEHLRTSEEPWKVLQTLPERVLPDLITICPYGQAGDRLWVRETFRHPSKENPRVRVDYRADMSSWGICDSHDVSANTVTKDAKMFPGRANEYSGQPWRPSIFMPRWASRITLEIDRVRVEPLRSISAEDALKEGIDHNPMADPRVEFQWLWESINGPFSWSLNTWVWVLEFHLCEKPSAS